jgi:hypothetical protein
MTEPGLPTYQDLLTLWKDADPDIPILKQAKAEYAKLQWPHLGPHRSGHCTSHPG